jgi:hypothetical protein
MLESAWDIIRQPSNNSSQVALAIAVIVLATTVGSFFAFLYGCFAREGGGFSRLTGGTIALLACGGSFAVGGMLGLLFGSPTWGGNAAVVSNDTEESTTTGQSAKAYGVRPNTSLERIADWLTTMIVGLSLVHLATIEERATSLSVWLTRSISGVASQENGTPGIVIAISFSFLGFLLVYLWCMRFLPSELRETYDVRKLRNEVEGVKQLSRSLEEILRERTQEFKDKAVFVVQPTKLDAIKASMLAGGVDEDTCNAIVERYRDASKADDEPIREFGPQSDKGFALSATVASLAAGYFSVQAKLTSPMESKADRVYWLLHNSFTPEVVSECPLVPGQPTTYSQNVNEAFWIGAVIPVPGRPAVRLSMYLGDVEDVPKDFLPHAANAAVGIGH